MNESEYREACRALRHFERCYVRAVDLTLEGRFTDLETSALQELLNVAAPALDRAIPPADSKSAVVVAVRNVTDKRTLQLDSPLTREDWLDVDRAVQAPRRAVIEGASIFPVAYQQEF